MTVVKSTPVTFPSGDSGSHVLWSGLVNNQLDIVVTVTETPAATADGMNMRIDAGAFHIDTGISPKDHGWVETRTVRFAGSPPSSLTAVDNSGNPPSAGLTQITVNVNLPGNSTTWVMSDVSVKQNGVEVVNSSGPAGSVVIV